MKRTVLNILALLALSLPSYAFASVWIFQNVTFNGPGLTWGHIPFQEGGIMSGNFTYDAGKITDWHISIHLSTSGSPPYDDSQLRPETEFDPLQPWTMFWQTAEVVSPTHLRFINFTSPAQNTQLDLLLNGPLAIGVTINQASNFAWDYNLHNQIFVTSGAIVPEPQVVASLAIGLLVLLVLKLRPTQAGTKQNLRRIG